MSRWERLKYWWKMRKYPPADRFLWPMEAGELSIPEGVSYPDPATVLVKMKKGR